MSALIKSSLLFLVLIFFTGFDTPVNNKTEFAKEIPILTYHHLLKKNENKLFRNNYAVLSVEVFEKQMRYLYDNGYSTVTLEELEKFIDGKIHLPQKSVVITFDDGYLSNYLYAYPILKKYGFNATIFAISSLIRDQPDRFHPDQLNYVSWSEIEKFRDVFHIESHTHDMHREENGKGYLIFKSTDVIKADMIKSKTSLNSFYFAYPYGQYDDTAIKLLKETGYKMAFTRKSGRVSPGINKYEIPRYSIYPTTKMRDFEKYISNN